ncbi:hypothetical protein ACFQ1E_09825 [Sphingomonas canadensis]|uniref:Uncharacterized protein n=1 Tax=Sphingomonas canadensis TaxID=1219257 RepID=A0ABW3H590_9SPHN|nr:hypothetical protein [Sphingomonas canadensis]MCW3836583.1 hypothetical protein [Sphingomonas canadensis]
MRRTTMFALAAAGAALLAAPGAMAQKRENGAREMMLSLGGGMKGKKLENAIKAADAFPVGSKQNPVRENSPAGEHAYLRRLRCADGSAPAYERRGNIGPGPYDFIVDLYAVTCPGQPAVDVHIDMYHDGPDDRPVPGFTIVPAED